MEFFNAVSLNTVNMHVIREDLISKTDLDYKCINWLLKNDLVMLFLPSEPGVFSVANRM